MAHLTDKVKKILYAGVGAASLTVEKSRELTDEMVQRGQQILEDSKISNEILAHTSKETVKARVKESLGWKEDITEIESVEEVLKNLTPAERQVIREKLDRLEREEEEYKEETDIVVSEEVE